MKNNPSLQAISDFIFTSKYARYIEHEQRRETWEEAVERTRNMHLKKFRHLSKENRDKIKEAFEAVKKKIVVPSMRSLQFGGSAIESHEAKNFNCSVRHIDSIRSFAEFFYLALNGVGIGIGLSEKFLKRLPDLVSPQDKTGAVITYVIEDTIEGWSDSVEALLNCYFKNTAYTGRKIVFDYSKIRKEGAPLKTSGGKAPGYKGLKNAHIKIKYLLDYVIEEKKQSRLRSIDVYDILMHVADAVLSGGIRRSASSTIFSEDDEDMMASKTDLLVQHVYKFSETDNGKMEGRVKYKDQKIDVIISKYEYENLLKTNTLSWFHLEPQRGRSNNSVLILRKDLDFEKFKTIFDKTRQYGEPGFVFANHKDTLFNPCFEVGFIPVTQDGVCGAQMCNLSSINGAKIKSLEDFKLATEYATIIGTLQASYTNFKYLSNTAKQLSEEEALLGVSITGMMDNPDILLNPTYQKECAGLAKEVNKKWAGVLGIKQAARICVIKPEGTSSLVLGSASGIHPHHARKYIRRVQCNKHDNVYKFLKKHNPHACEESIYSANKTDDVASFPLEISENSMIKSDLNALKHLEIIKSTQINWVETGKTEANKKDISHNVSCTVMVEENEWDSVAKYLFENKDSFAAVSLLPSMGDKIYKQAPLEAVISEEDIKKFEELKAKFVAVDFKELNEKSDNTHLQQEIACGGGGCDLTSI